MALTTDDTTDKLETQERPKHHRNLTHKTVNREHNELRITSRLTNEPKTIIHNNHQNKRKSESWVK